MLIKIFHRETIIKCNDIFSKFVCTNILELKAEKNNIFSSFDEIVQKAEKEKVLNQKGVTFLAHRSIWFWENNFRGFT